MDGRIHFITIRVSDLARSRAFYVEGLGWPPTMEAPGEFFTLDAGPFLRLSFLKSQVIDGVPDPEPEAPMPAARARPCETREDVDQLLARARSVGATITAPRESSAGSYEGAFTDPDGVRWEIAFRPGGAGWMMIANA